MLFVFIVTVMSKSCQEDLNMKLSADLISRIDRFNMNQGGLDSLKNYSECLKLPNSTYVSIFWKQYEFYNAHYGFCLPSDCTEEVSKDVLDSFIQSNNISNLISNEGYDICFVPIKDPKIGFSGIFFLSSFIMMIIFGVIGSIFISKNKKFGFWKCFSAKDNIKRLFNFNESFGDLQFFDGVRAYSSMSIVFLHIIYLSIKIPSTNRSALLQKYNMLSSFFFTSYSVDIFFFLAGAVMTLNIVQDLNKLEGKINWFKHIVKRMVRYYPVYLFSIGINLLAVGLPPPSSQIIPIHCEYNRTNSDWVKSLVFLHALFPSTSTIYLIYTWSIAYDFYFFLLSCLILKIYYHKKTLGYLIALFILTFSIIYTGVVSYTNNLSPSFTNLLLNRKEMNLIYFNPICRVSSYIIGNVFGLIYLASKKKNVKVSVAFEVKDGFGDSFEREILKLCKIKQVRFWLHVSGFGIFGFLCIWPVILSNTGEDLGGLVINAIFLGLQRMLIGLACAFLFLPSALGYLSRISEFLKKKAYILPARLSYAVYLIHPFVFTSFFMTDNTEKVWSNIEIVYNSMLTYALSIIIGGIIQVLIESPILALEKTLFR